MIPVLRYRLGWNGCGDGMGFFFFFFFFFLFSGVGLVGIKGPVAFNLKRACINPCHGRYISGTVSLRLGYE